LKIAILLTALLPPVTPVTPEMAVPQPVTVVSAAMVEWAVKLAGHTAAEYILTGQPLQLFPIAGLSTVQPLPVMPVTAATTALLLLYGDCPGLAADIWENTGKTALMAAVYIVVPTLKLLLKAARSPAIP
jgi:hypothetical protein